ncbi:MAG: formylglycine-generating enzyme family protein [Xenococcaceae cyanobacterium MO_167.B27]|nr:formylglycine-generating enzyme family protein [Xenococcaceae cyanobacterium MO_167.B27]
MANFFIERQKRTTKYSSEDLGNGIKLDMVLIPEGDFIMGAAEDELDSTDAERPQHKVTVSTFFMGRYPVTQEQWRAVAALPQVNRELKADPSRFKGDKRPVEQVSWYEAIEFCQRLSQHTELKYTLPSEAEWEYACRAGTTTPFHFGATITTDLANYRGTDYEEFKWSGSYGEGPKGKYREETTPVGTFPPNNFGLWDMHGNVWEWCEDLWHDNYQDAPTNGSSWTTNSNSSCYVLRGGSWDSRPNSCRSAARYLNYRVLALNYIGFRVVCRVPRTL